MKLSGAPLGAGLGPVIAKLGAMEFAGYLGNIVFDPGAMALSKRLLPVSCEPAEPSRDRLVVWDKGCCEES